MSEPVAGNDNTATRAALIAITIAAVIGIAAGCASTRPDGSKARLGDGVLTTKLGEVPLGDLLDKLAPILEVAGHSDPNIALASRLIAGRSGKDVGPEGATKTSVMRYNGEPIDPALLELVETWERRSTFKPAMQVVKPLPADAGAIDAAVDAIIGSGIVDEATK